MVRAALYMRVSTVDQHPENQSRELREFAKQREYEIVREYIDHGVSGVKVRRPSLDKLLNDARRAPFEVVLSGLATGWLEAQSIFLRCLTN